MGEGARGVRWQGKESRAWKARLKVEKGKGKRKGNREWLCEKGKRGNGIRGGGKMRKEKRKM